MRKTIFLDLQNTICGQVGLFTPEQKHLLTTINEKNNLVLTSNVFASDMEYIMELNGIKFNYIADSGAYLKLNNKIYKEVFLADLSIINNYINDIVFLFYETDLIFNIYNYEDRLRSLYPIKPLKTNFIKSFQDFKPNYYTNIIICIYKNSKMLSHLFNQDSINLQLIGQDYTKIIYKITKKNINKGHFIPQVLKELQSDYINSISVGDSTEDLSMFKQTKLKIATKNGEDILKNKADIIVPSFLENGALNYLVNNT